MYEQNTIDGIKEILLKQGETIAVAESVTSGHLQVALASAEYAAKFFQGGITAYNLGQKARHLHIEPIHAESCNCVSELVAAQMALNINKLFSSDWGIATTGYAAPVPECSVEEPFAYYAIAFRDNILQVKKINAGKMDAMKVQIDFTNQILREFQQVVKKGITQSSFSISDRNSINSKLVSVGPFSTSPSTE